MTASPWYMRLVRRAELLTKTDMVYLGSGSFWLTLDEAAGALVAFLLSVAFAHFVSKDAYGSYRFLIAFFWILTAFTMTGLPTALQRAIAQGKEGTYPAAIRFSLTWSLPLVLIAAIISMYYFWNANPLLGFGLLIIAIGGLFVQAAYLWGTYLVGKQEFRMLALLGSLFAFIPALLLIGTMLVTQNPLAFLAAYFIGTVTTGLIFNWYLIRRYRPNEVVDGEYRKLGGHFSAMNLLSTIAAQIDKIVVYHYLGAVELAVYAFATALPEQGRGLFNSISLLALPKFAERPWKEILHNFWYRLWLFTGVMVVVAVLYIAIAPFLYHLLFPAYGEAILYSQIYALSLIPIGNAIPMTLLQAHKAKRELYVYNILTPLFLIGSLIVLTSLYGLLGAVVARIISRTFGFILITLLVKVHDWRIALT